MPTDWPEDLKREVFSFSHLQKKPDSKSNKEQVFLFLWNVTESPFVFRTHIHLTKKYNF